ncbi:MAG: ABC transporter substrate-binding protein, partial [Actinobacteria bacterium]|nr:ABC transporter substrate-binding protein [Actinomycetota bacterium]
MKTRFRVVGLLATAALAAATLTGCSSSNELIIATDLPLQGASFDSNDSTNKAIELYLKQQDYKAGDYKVKLKIYDNATAAKGSWDDAKCAQNAQDHVANKNEIAVMGTYNSGCAKIIVPIINQAPGGAILMISDANTNPGLTKAWEPGEPDIYYPSGVRNYARVCTTDDNQGSAAAQFAQSIGIKSIFVLNDNQTYGQGVGTAVTAEANKLGLKVLSSGTSGEAWDAKQASYEALFTKIKALKPDMIYIAGIFDNNGGQLIKDKVKVLGDNTKVKIMAPDGFTGYPDFVKMPEADGAYLTFAGLSTDLLLAN